MYIIKELISRINSDTLKTHNAFGIQITYEEIVAMNHLDLNQGCLVDNAINLSL